MVSYSYRYIVEYFQSKLIDLNQNIDIIYDFMTIHPSGASLGVPKFGTVGITEDVKSANYKMEKASSAKEAITQADIIISHMVDSSDKVFKYLNDGLRYITEGLKKSKDFLKEPKIHIRDWHVDPHAAELMRIIATQFDGKVSFDVLKRFCIKYAYEFDDLIDRIPLQWKNCLIIDYDEQSIQMNDSDYRDILALFGSHPIEFSKELAELKHVYNTKDLVILHFIKEFGGEKYQSYADAELKKAYDKYLEEYPQLFSKYQLKSFYDLDILKITDFLDFSFETILSKIPISRDELIHAKLTLAASIGYDCRNFELDIIPYALANYATYDSFRTALIEVKKLFKSDIITFANVLDQNEFFLTSNEIRNRHICYRIIAFVREFHSKCISTSGFNYIPPGPKWPFSKQLTAKELEHAKLLKTNNTQPPKIENSKHIEAKHDDSLDAEKSNVRTDPNNEPKGDIKT